MLLTLPALAVVVGGAGCGNYATGFAGELPILGIVNAGCAACMPAMLVLISQIAGDGGAVGLVMLSAHAACGPGSGC